MAAMGIEAELSVIVKVEPLSGPALTADTVPRCPFTTDFTMKRPRPVPV
jgi:hypothetical protein